MSTAHYTPASCPSHLPLQLPLQPISFFFFFLLISLVSFAWRRRRLEPPGLAPPDPPPTSRHLCLHLWEPFVRRLAAVVGSRLNIKSSGGGSCGVWMEGLRQTSSTRHRPPLFSSAGSSVKPQKAILPPTHTCNDSLVEDSIWMTTRLFLAPNTLWQISFLIGKNLHLANEGKKKTQNESSRSHRAKVEV